MEWRQLKDEFDLYAMEVLDWIEGEYNRIRSGRVSLNILDPVRVEAYGDHLNLNQVSNLQIVDARQILIKPYDRNQIQDIAKAIVAANINVNPQINADSIRLLFPSQTEENRRDNVKKAKVILEQAKTKLRDVRKKVQDMYKKIKDTISEDLVHYFEEELNKITKSYTTKLESVFTSKEQELMKI